jgi:hypothetical protein
MRPSAKHCWICGGADFPKQGLGLVRAGVLGNRWLLDAATGSAVEGSGVATTGAKLVKDTKSPPPKKLVSIVKKLPSTGAAALVMLLKILKSPEIPLVVPHAPPGVD